MKIRWFNRVLSPLCVLVCLVVISVDGWSWLAVGCVVIYIANGGLWWFTGEASKVKTRACPTCGTLWDYWREEDTKPGLYSWANLYGTNPLIMLDGGTEPIKGGYCPECGAFLTPEV